MGFLISTTGTVASVIFDDLGKRIFTHPIVNFDLNSEFTVEQIRDSVSVQNALDLGWITATDDESLSITSLDKLDDRETLDGSIIQVHGVSDESESSTTSTTPQTKLTTSYSVIENADYLVSITFEIRSSASNKDVNSRVIIDSTERAKHDSDFDLYQTASTSYTLNKAASSTLDIDIEYNAAAGATTAYIRRARVKIFKIS